MARGSRPVYVISIAASIAGCHPRTLRIYEEEGLVDPVRTDSNIRLYSDEDLQRVRIIRDAADLLREIANAIEDVDADTDASQAAQPPKRMAL